jgi:hypothetical protein
LKQRHGYGPFNWDDVVGIPEDKDFADTYYLLYFGIFRPLFREYYFDDVTEYEVEVIDTWNMTIINCGIFKGKIHVDLPGKQYMAIRIKKYGNSN